MKNNKIIKISAPEDQIGYWFRYVSNNIAHSFSRKLEANSVTVAEWIILRQMYETGKTSPGVVALNIGLTKGAISKLISRLLKKRLVVRESSITDRRFQDIKLTDKGKKLVPRLAQLADENDELFFGNLSLRQKNGLEHLLKNIVKMHHLRKALSMRS